MFLLCSGRGFFHVVARKLEYISINKFLKKNNLKNWSCNSRRKG